MTGWCPTACSRTLPSPTSDCSEGDARRLNISARVARLPMSAVLRTQTTGETEGFMKALVEQGRPHPRLHDDRARTPARSWPWCRRRCCAGLAYWQLRDAVLAHPTMAEGLDPLFSNLPRR